MYCVDLGLENTPCFQNLSLNDELRFIYTGIVFP